MPVSDPEQPVGILGAQRHDPARAAKPGAARHDPHSVGDKRRGQAVAVKSLHVMSVQPEGHRAGAVYPAALIEPVSATHELNSGSGTGIAGGGATSSIAWLAVQRRTRNQ